MLCGDAGCETGLTEPACEEEGEVDLRDTNRVMPPRKYNPSNSLLSTMPLRGGDCLMLTCDECAFSRSFWRMGYRDANKRLGFIKDKKAGAPESLLFGENL